MEGFYPKSRITEYGIYCLLRAKKLKPNDKILYDHLCIVACFKERPFKDGKKNVTVGVGEYIISRRRLFKEMSSLGIFDSEGGLRRSVERLKKGGLISTDSDGQSTQRFRILHYNTDYLVEPSLDPQNTTKRAQSVSQPNPLTNKVNTESVRQDYRHIKEECSIKEEECNSSNIKDTYIPEETEPDISDDSDSKDSEDYLLSMDSYNNGPEGPYGMDENDIQVSEDDWIYVAHNSDEEYDVFDDSIDTDFNKPTNSNNSKISPTIVDNSNSPLGSGLDGFDDEWDDEEENEDKEEWNDSDDDIDRELPSPPDIDPRLREYKEQDLTDSQHLLVNNRIIRYFCNKYPVTHNGLAGMAANYPEEFAEVKTKNINFIGQHHQDLLLGEEIEGFITDWKDHHIPEFTITNEYDNAPQNKLTDSLVETIGNRGLTNPDTCFLVRLENYIVENMVDPNEVSLAYVFQENVLDGILKTPANEPDYSKYSQKEWTLVS